MSTFFSPTADFLQGGLRTQGHFKSSRANKPLITVVTVVFNGEQFIEETIQSIINQTYDNIEYLIIDGGSNDGTLDIVRKYQHLVDYWVSEKDKGIYDAMNKGISLALGEWVNFMNAGDMFFSAKVVTEIFSNRIGNEKIIFGDVHIRYLDFARVELAGCPKKLWSGMQFCHQSAFVNLQYHRLTYFNIKNKIAADLEFFYRAYRGKASFKYYNFVFSSVQIGGVSELNRLQAVLASQDAVLAGGASRIVCLYYAFKSIDTVLRFYLKKILPRSVVKRIIQQK